MAMVIYGITEIFSLAFKSMNPWMFTREGIAFTKSLFIKGLWTTNMVGVLNLFIKLLGLSIAWLKTYEVESLSKAVSTHARTS
jgi:hypothetical protein